MPSMQITHIRRGFATNSSSTHSILELAPGLALPESTHTDWRERDDHYERFVVSDRASRIDYLHAMAAIGARDVAGWNDEDEWYRLYRQLAQALPGGPLAREDARDLHIDHLPGWSIPRIIHTREMDVDYFAHVARLLLSERVVVMDDEWPNAKRGEYLHLLEGEYDVSKRVGDNEWSLLSFRNGRKCRVRFDEAGRQFTRPISPSRALEMVDVSISNACGRMCPFCYRASVPDGAQADIRQMKALVRGLKEADAMEMVIGGGEPTEHPDFYPFLRDTDFGDLCVSCTTRDLDFIASLARVNRIKPDEVLETLCGKVKAIGLSVQTAAEVKLAERNLAALRSNERPWPNRPALVFHVIPGPEWREVLVAVHEGQHDLLLLGMKFTGRQTGVDPKAYADAVGEMLESESLKKRLGNYSSRRRYERKTRLGVDTQFLVDAHALNPAWRERLDWRTWSDTEGEWSAFIDLVDETMAPCSFGGEKVKLDGLDGTDLLKAFDRIGAYKPKSVMEGTNGI